MRELSLVFFHHTGFLFFWPDTSYDWSQETLLPEGDRTSKQPGSLAQTSRLQ